MSEIKLFNKWSYEGLKVKDAGIADYINITPIIAPRTSGKYASTQFYKSKMNVVERIMTKLFVAGHRGKKHKLTSGRMVGKTQNVANIVIEAFEIIEKKTQKNPLEILITAVENAAPLEEAISYQRGGIFVREGVITSPQRRVDLALKHICQGTQAKSYSNKRSAGEALAEEILAAAKGETASFAYSEKMRREKEASGAR
ncbi:MAG: 30S ribosomal protein S7 [Nanoarchaeota archaeon]|nr:30S ribosomal protein S7 [Nanoarchaeota archaeon]MBU4299959.1 30S ribosomal protein S7 [Nanoarchaeota archaeon]MBU4452236.1 30S ribosomal protein S7 [Nanoarchaeota archaeon]MCG2723663.1 30S ribosomal protein S7 [archaeon]